MLGFATRALGSAPKQPIRRPSRPLLHGLVLHHNSAALHEPRSQRPRRLRVRSRSSLVSTSCSLLCYCPALPGSWAPDGCESPTQDQRPTVRARVTKLNNSRSHWRFRFLVALLTVRDLLFCAKHLFAAANGGSDGDVGPRTAAGSALSPAAEPCNGFFAFQERVVGLRGPGVKVNASGAP